MAASVAAGEHLHPGLDPATGPQLGPPAQAGLRRRSARGAALLVAGEVRHPRTGAVRGDPGHPARLARVEMRVKRSEEHTSELQSLMRKPYHLLCLTQKKTDNVILDDHDE